MAILTVIKTDESVIPLPDPNGYAWSKVPKIGTSGTNQNGDSFKDIIASKREITVSWGVLNQVDMAVILNAVDEPYFELQCIDPQLNTMDTVEVECNSPSVGTLSVINNVPVYSSLKIKFKER